MENRVVQKDVQQFWYNIDRDAKKLSTTSRTGDFQTIQDLFDWIHLLCDEIQRMLQAPSITRIVPIVNKKNRDHCIDFFRELDLKTSLYLISRIYLYTDDKDSRYIQNVHEQMMNVLKEKQPYRPTIQYVVISPKTTESVCSISFFRMSNTFDKITKSGNWMLLPSFEKRSKGMPRFVTWLMQMYMTNFDRTETQIPFYFFNTSTRIHAKSFLGANSSASFYRLQDDSIAKLYINQDFAKTEFETLVRLSQHPAYNGIKVIDASNYALRLTPLAKKVKSIEWKDAVDLFHDLMFLHSQNLIHQIIIPDNIMRGVFTKRVFFVNFENAIECGKETNTSFYSKQILSDRILGFRKERKDSFFAHFNDDLQAFVRTIMILIEGISVPSNESPQFLLSFWRRVVHRRPFWAELDVSASRGQTDLIHNLLLTKISQNFIDL